MARSHATRHPAPAAQSRLARAGMGVLGALAPRLTTRLVFRLFRTPRRARFNALPLAAQVRSSGTPFRLSHGQGTLEGLAWGDGPAVLLVHGWESNSDHMLNFVTPLTARGFKVIAFDGPAHGRSSGTQTDLLDFHRALVTVARQLGPVSAVVGHSFGAAAVLLALAGSPDFAPRAAATLGAPIDLEFMIAVVGATLGLRPAMLARLRESIEARYGPVDQFSVRTVAGRIATPGLVVRPRRPARAVCARRSAAECLAGVDAACDRGARPSRRAARRRRDPSGSRFCGVDAARRLTCAACILQRAAGNFGLRARP